MEKLKILDSHGRLLHSNHKSECNQCFSSCDSPNEIFTDCVLKLGKRRRSVLESGQGKILFCSGLIDDIKSSKCFKRKVDTYLKVVKGVSEISTSISNKKNSSTEVLLHNIISLNAHNIQEVHAVIPQDITGLNYKDKIENAKKLIKRAPHIFANSIYRISKNNMAMKMEFSVFNRLFGESPELSVRKHDLKKAFLSIFHNFFQDFNEKNVSIDVEGDSFDIYFDYESMHVIFNHLLENAAKYCLKNHNIVIKLSEIDKSIAFEMRSIEISDEDVTHIFEEGYSGVHAQLAEKSGKGIGMNRVKKLLELNKASIEIRRNDDNSPPTIYKNIPYLKNTIIIRFNGHVLG